jgi:leucyl aminopeptidase
MKHLAFNLAARYSYRFDKYTSHGDSPQPLPLYIYDNKYSLSSLDRRNVYVTATKDLINEPANIATPQYICDWARERFAGVPHTTLTVLDEEEIRQAGLNLVIAVAQGSTKPPRFLIVDYHPPSAQKTVCLCGKGVVFDAGGTNAKIGPANSYTMKGDKTGGCIVLGIVDYFAKEARTNTRLVAIVPLVENVVSGSATRPGDIFKSHSGKTVEILDTDAEGRLILADAMSFARRYRPDYILDFATLTRWSAGIHCDTSAVYFTASAKLAALVESIGEEVGDRVWGMPRWLDYMSYCKSAVADLKNADLTIDGCTSGGGFMAAMFMAHFVPHKLRRERWVHFDIGHNIDDHVMNANSMVLGIELIKRL